jgi:hypothetical protein
MTNEYIDLSTTFSHKRNEEIKNQGYFGVGLFWLNKYQNCQQKKSNIIPKKSKVFVASRILVWVIVGSILMFLSLYFLILFRCCLIQFILDFFTHEKEKLCQTDFQKVFYRKKID